MTAQTTDLVMLALGCDGGASQLEDGVHLRWQVSEQVGYPPFGFDVLRRPHRPGSGERSITIPASIGGKFDLGNIYRSLTVQCSSGATSWISARFAGGEMLRRQVAGAGFTVRFAADAIDELEAGSGLTISEVRGVDVDDEANLGWSMPLNGAVKIGLPLTDPAYPCRHPRAPDDWAEAKARLQRPGWSAAALAALEARFGGPQFGELQSVLRAVMAGGASPMRNTPAGQIAPNISLAPTHLLALAATDPDFARIIGLLLVDRDAPVAEHFDYRVIGYWSSGGTTVTRRCTQVPPPSGIKITPGTVIRVPVPTGNISRSYNADDRDPARSAPLSLIIQSCPVGEVVSGDSPWGRRLR